MIRKHAFRIIGLAGMFAFTLLGCSESPVARVDDPLEVYWALETDSRAITMAMGDTQRLVLKPIRFSGDVITEPPTRTSFVSGDSTLVSVTEDGLLQAHIPTGSPVTVIANVQIGNITHTQRFAVAVTPIRYSLASFEMSPLGPPGPVVPVVTTGGMSLLGYTAMDAVMGPVPPILAVDTRSLDSLIAIYRGSNGMGPLFGQTIGKVDVVATTKSYGKLFADTIEFTVTYPTQITVPIDTVSRGPEVREVRIVTGGQVSWLNPSATPVDITFQNDTENIVGGDIPALVGMQSRQFTKAGRYRYTTNNGASEGVVLVEDPLP